MVQVRDLVAGNGGLDGDNEIGSSLNELVPAMNFQLGLSY